MKAFVIASAAAILGPAGEPPAQSSVLERSHLGQTLPELELDRGDWIGEQRPTLRELRGGPVLLVFTVLW